MVDTLKHYVAIGLDSATLSGLRLVEKDRSKSEMIQIPDYPGPETTYGIIVRRDKHRPATLQTLIRLLKQH